jgi:hypothetical protein
MGDVVERAIRESQRVLALLDFGACGVSLAAQRGEPSHAGNKVRAIFGVDWQVPWFAAPRTLMASAGAG